MAHDAPRPRRPTPAERRTERAAIEDPGAVLEDAARLLEARPRSEAEVRTRLTRAGYRGELVELAIARLLEIGLLDDEAFARGWVESRDRARPRGEHALRRELGLRGVAGSTIDAVLAERRDEAGSGAPGADPDEAAAERLLARRRHAIQREPDPRRRQQKAYALLARHGFSPDVCATVARRAVASSGDDDDGAEHDA